MRKRAVGFSWGLICTRASRRRRQVVKRESFRWNSGVLFFLTGIRCVRNITRPMLAKLVSSGAIPIDLGRQRPTRCDFHQFAGMLVSMGAMRASFSRIRHLDKLRRPGRPDHTPVVDPLASSMYQQCVCTRMCTCTCTGVCMHECMHVQGTTTSISPTYRYTYIACASFVVV